MSEQQVKMPTVEELRLLLRRTFEQRRSGDFSSDSIGTLKFAQSELVELNAGHVYYEELRRSDLIKHGYVPPDVLNACKTATKNEEELLTDTQLKATRGDNKKNVACQKNVKRLPHACIRRFHIDNTTGAFLVDGVEWYLGEDGTVIRAEAMTVEEKENRKSFWAHRSAGGELIDCSPIIERLLEQNNYKLV